MDEKTAWKIFCSTGKVTDYMRYSEIKNEVEFVKNIKEIEDLSYLGEVNDNKNPGTYN
ncbi:MAG: hypothetical protein R3Y35_04760 [Clostridia bacterium]